MSFPGIKEISILLTNLKSSIIDSSMPASPFLSSQVKSERRTQPGGTGLGSWKQGCKKGGRRPKAKTMAPSTWSCPIERIDASEISSRELTLLFLQRAQTFPNTLCSPILSSMASRLRRRRQKRALRSICKLHTYFCVLEYVFFFQNLSLSLSLFLKMRSFRTQRNFSSTTHKYGGYKWLNSAHIFCITYMNNICFTFFKKKINQKNSLREREKSLKENVGW